MFDEKKSSLLIPIDQVAERLQTTPLNVLMHIKRGKIAGREEAGGWLVESESLEAFLAGQEGADKSLCRSSCSKAGGCSSCG